MPALGIGCAGELAPLHELYIMRDNFNRSTIPGASATMGDWVQWLLFVRSGLVSHHSHMPHEHLCERSQGEDVYDGWMCHVESHIEEYDARM